MVHGASAKPDVHVHCVTMVHGASLTKEEPEVHVHCVTRLQVQCVATVHAASPSTVKSEVYLQQHSKLNSNHHFIIIITCTMNWAIGDTSIRSRVCRGVDHGQMAHQCAAK
jgi:hypothetical protein